MANQLKNMLKKIVMKSFLRTIYIVFMTCRDSNISIFKYWFSKEKNYVFMTAIHNNAGDIAQTVCINEWIKENYSGAVINVVWTAPEWKKDLKKICCKVRESDRVFIQSGYNITDISDEYAAPSVFTSHNIILESLPNHKIVFFPQSVEYKSLEKWKPITEMYSRHKNIVFISRDNISLGYSKKLLPNAKHLCYPDIVTTWIGKFSFDKPQSGILLCLRSGAESILNDEAKHKLQTAFEKIAPTEMTDTDIDYKSFYYRKNRMKVVLKKIQQFSRFKVIVTDRFHGVVFSLIGSRPVIVLKTSGHKVTGMIDWFPDSFKEYVYFIDNPDDIPNICSLIIKLFERESEPLNNTYFQDKYYNKLKDKIESF